MPSYYYSSTAGAYTLTGAINSSATSVTLNSVSGLPGSTPFKVVLDPGQSSEEIVKVTGVAGTTLTVVRAWDGTSAVSHSAGASVRHMVTAEDFTLSRAHEDATAAHGATGAVMGTTNTQVVTNKDLTSGTNTFPSSFATLTGTQALTNKDLSSGTNTFPASLATASALTSHTGTSVAHGATGAVVGTTNTQTLTNKVVNTLATSPSTVPLIAKGSPSGQTANLTEWRDSSDNLIASVDRDGKLTTPQVTATGNVTAANLPAVLPAKAGKRMHWANYSGTTNASGFLTLAHGAGFTPGAVFVYNNNPTSGFGVLWGVEALDATNFRTRWADASSNSPLNAASVSFTALLLEA